jgi:glycosyltransferase involved in cell wall biosynthesis
MKNMGKKIIFTVFNDTAYDQRMIRICGSLAKAGYQVVFIGRRPAGAGALTSQAFRQRRLANPFKGGFLLYASFNIQLFLYLLTQKADAICAIDLDTILPCYFISRLKRITRIYDAHELFCEMQEIVSRPRIYSVWKRIEQFAVPAFGNGYTVNNIIAEEFRKMYQVHYAVIRSIALAAPLPPASVQEPYIIYQGAVNEGRCFETLIPAMQWVDMPLHIYGDGNFLQQAKELTAKYSLQDKVLFKGKLEPPALQQVTPTAAIGITLFNNTARSNYYSLANRFFDYMQAGVPQLCVAYPAYKEINNLYEIAVLIDDLSAENIAAQLNTLINSPETRRRLSANCMLARQVLSWQEEEKKLLAFYNKILS